MKAHIWRYDAETPNAELPWIVSCEGMEDPPNYATWTEALAAVQTGKVATYFGIGAPNPEKR